MHMGYYRILSLDGGGIKGLLMAIILERLDHIVPGFLSQIDLFAGTSTGGLLALGLAYGKTPQEARKIYEERGKNVFADTLLDEVRDLGSLVGADYSIEPLKQELTAEFGSTRLADLPKKVLISSFDLDQQVDGNPSLRSWKAKFFHNYPGSDSDGNESVVDVGICTSAAPTFFPIFKGFIDGGVVANNPSVCALAQALHPASGGQESQDIVLFSMGTGRNPRHIESVDGDWGLIQWAPQLVHLVMEGSADLADYQCRQILRERYLRVNPLLPFPIGMDRVNQIPLIVQIANQYPLDVAISWLKEFF
jgi:uncharacterized protein